MNRITVPMDEPKPSCHSTLSTASHLTRSELLKRRFQNLKRLSKCYRDLYWHLMEHVKILYRNYLYHYALNPFSHFHFPTCAFLGCNLKPMPFTSFCHFHILSDSNQKLYKPCNYVIKGAEAGPITCGKPILRSIVPALCTVHSHKAQKHLARALKRNSRNISSTTNIPPKFHALVSEFVKHIQARRKKQQENKSKTVFKDRMIAA
ncbi:INO80 complex subunit D-like isoform X1 [Vigna umbellata]|uniref:INO80 complex subunit D-like isoform X1 n=1 Tax=Vigna umbellata TaxID=87088 RepID=UPI001F5E61A1|nr:INO80 complex subunit D-like isoform X1 [Vigna umbellata]